MGFIELLFFYQELFICFVFKNEEKNPLLFCMHKHTVCCQVIFSVVVV